MTTKKPKRFLSAILMSGLLLMATVFAAALAASPQMASAASQVTLTVDSADLSGNSITGMLAKISDARNGTLLKSGFTPLTFIGSGSAEYKVQVANYDGRVFKQWKDGSKEKMRLVTLPSNSNGVTITATYDPSNSQRGFTPLTYTDTGKIKVQQHLTVQAISIEGNVTLHMWAIIDPQLKANSNQEQMSQSSSGGSNVNGMTGTTSTTYRIYAHNYKDIIFDHWSDNGSKDRIRDITIAKDVIIYAYYKLTNPIFSSSHVVFAQKTAREFPDIPQSLRGVDAHFTCPDSSVTDGNFFGFSATSIPLLSIASGTWSTIAAPGAAAGDDGTITGASINSTHFRLEGKWTHGGFGTTSSEVCFGTPLPSTVVIEGPCGVDVHVAFLAANGVTGSFRGNATCT